MSTDERLADWTPAALIEFIAKEAEQLGFLAGVGGRETAGAIISYLALKPEREVNTRWSSVGPAEELPPICRYCERTYAEGIGKPTSGSFRDRRNALRIAALAEALHTTAMRIHWSTAYAAA